MPQVVRKPQARQNLESAVVRLIHAAGGVSRVDLARSLKLVPSTAGIYVDRLIHNKILLEAASPVRGLGRPPVVLQLNPKAGRFVGVDFDARQILAKAVDFAQQPLAEARRLIPARAGVERVLEIIGEAIEEVAGPRRAAARTGRDLLGIGLGVPGPVDPERGVSLYYAHLPNWRDVPIGPHFAERFGVPTFVENNLRSMALAEHCVGHGRGLRNLVCLGVRSGIGSGILVDGKLLHGAHNTAGEIGRWVYPGAKPTKDDRPTTIEDVSSVSALLAAADLATVADLSAALERGDRRVVALVRQAAEVHGWVAHQLVALFDPETIVVSGPLVEHETYWSALRAAAERCGPDAAARLRPSTLGPFAGASGAAALAFQHWKPRR